MLLRHEPKFSADWMISGMSATSFNWAVLHKSDVILLMEDNEETYKIKGDTVTELLYVDNCDLLILLPRNVVKLTIVIMFCVGA